MTAVARLQGEPPATSVNTRTPSPVWHFSTACRICISNCSVLMPGIKSIYSTQDCSPAIASTAERNPEAKFIWPTTIIPIIFLP
uniref:Uncharacterized protein n=1 Tax=Yersinia enterocolitica TaxID=630 RepID=B0RKR0_YEREN|nr:hypothetical protein [Yersinia enterocolitica]